MHVFFYNKEDKGNLLLDYVTSPYNNIPRIGEKVVIKDKWYLVEDIVNIYKKPTDCTFTVVCVYFKAMED